jgi:hypothetical protein
LIELRPDADYRNLDALAKELVDRITSYTEEQQQYDENDSFFDYLDGLIGAYQSVATMIGVPHEIAYPNGDC